MGKLRNSNDQQGRKIQPSSANGKSIKIKYISSPIKVSVDPSEFRSIVHELTGKNSEVFGPDGSGEEKQVVGIQRPSVNTVAAAAENQNYGGALANFNSGVQFDESSSCFWREFSASFHGLPETSYVL